MRVFLDTSSYAKRFIEEEGSEKLDELLDQASELCLSILCIPELFSALNRRLRSLGITPRDYAAVKIRIAEEIEDATIIQLSPRVVQISIDVLEASSLRALDALHVASAIACHADIFVSSDERQIQAARKAGMKTRKV